MVEPKNALMYGGGSIGRGFLGQLFHMSGFHTCFVDVDEKLVKELAGNEKYTIQVAKPSGYEEYHVDNITAVNGLDTDKVSDCIAGCSIMATAVGVNILPKIAGTIASGLEKRAMTTGAPLDIIVCENISDSGNFLKELVLEKSSSHDFIEKKVGFVSASVGRMVPVSNTSGIIVESYNELPIDKDAMKTDVSDIDNFLPVSPFAIEKYKKYFMHNMSHAITAYLGYLKGYEFIWQAIEDKEILSIAKGALYESIEAISSHFNSDRVSLEAYAADLLDRYSNKYLADTVLRVGRDPIRKLGAGDRLSGAAAFCTKNGVDTEFIPYGIAAALKFDPSDDVSASVLSEYIKVNGITAALSHFAEIDMNSSLSMRVIEIYQAFS